MKTNPGASFSLRLQVQAKRNSDGLAALVAAVSSVGGQVHSVETVDETRSHSVYAVVVFCRNLDHEKEVAAAAAGVDAVCVKDVAERVYDAHFGGKMEIAALRPLKTAADLSIAYTPGVGRVCMAVHDKPELAYTLTCKRNTVAVVSDGTAVLGLGDIGPEAAMPVMEGKALLFKEFGGVDAFPICISTKDTEEIIKLVKQLEPTFGGINLEDISAPRCFEIEERLKAEMNIPVFHDDQHGTAVVTTAALINALKITGKKAEDLKTIVCGVGAAGVACTKMLMGLGVRNIIGCDRKGAIYKGRTENMNSMKDWYAENTNPNCLKGSLQEVLKDADLFLGLSGPGLLTEDDVKSMAKGAILFAMSNPVPEIMPEIAGPHVAVMATGRSDYPNQINNVLAFPGIFRGALDCHASSITENMKLAAAHAIADIVGDDLQPDYIIPSPFDARVAPAVAKAVLNAAKKDGVARDYPDAIPSLDQIER